MHTPKGQVIANRPIPTETEAKGKKRNSSRSASYLHKLQTACQVLCHKGESVRSRILLRSFVPGVYNFTKPISKAMLV